MSALVCLGCAAGGFKRPFSEYIHRLEGFLKYDMPKILYCETKYKDQIQDVINRVGRNKIELRFKTTDEIR